MEPALRLSDIGQISRTVSDIARSEKWYRDVLGLKHLYTFGKLSFFDCGGVRLFLEEDKDGAQRESVIYLRVGDIESACRRLTERGVRFVHSPHLIHRHADGVEEWMAFFNDPDERLLAIMSQVRPQR